MDGALETEQVHEAEQQCAVEGLLIEQFIGILSPRPLIEQWPIRQQQPDAQQDRPRELAPQLANGGRFARANEVISSETHSLRGTTNSITAVLQARIYGGRWLEVGLDSQG
jgi:hypothetical protein